MENSVSTGSSASAIVDENKGCWFDVRNEPKGFEILHCIPNPKEFYIEKKTSKLKAHVLEFTEFNANVCCCLQSW